MNSIAVQQKRYARLAPSNNSSQGFAPESSQPIIRFSVADTQAIANMKEARLNFRLRVTTAPGAPVALTDDVNIDSRVGVSGIIDQILINSRRYGSSLEQVHNAGRLNSQIYDSLHSPKQMMCNQNLQTRGIGYGRYNGMIERQNRANLLNDENAKYFRRQLITSATAVGKSYELLDCSIPIHCGLFFSEELDLNKVGGLEIAIFLQKSSFLFNGAGVPATMNYSLQDVSLSIPLLYKSAAMIQQDAQSPQGVVEYMAYTSVFSVLDSTFTSIAHRLNMRSLLSSIHNFQPTAAINDRTRNNFALLDSGLEELTIMKDGQRYPMEKTAIVDCDRAQPQRNRASTQAEVLHDALSSFRNYRDILYTQVIPQSLKGVPANLNQGHYSIGVNYAPQTGSGVDVAGVLSYDILTKLESVANAAQTEPYAFYSFYLDKKTLVITPNGIASA
tara:strand:- start:452 stop:1789 length:1338 start_codon:yes stop_codon:yes gene_type:complete